MKTLENTQLSVGLRHTLDLVLLLNGVAVGRTLRGVHDLISQALSHRLDVAERGFASLFHHSFRSNQLPG